MSRIKKAVENKSIWYHTLISHMESIHESIFRTIKKEFDMFEAKKNRDFKHTIVKYLEKMLK